MRIGDFEVRPDTECWTVRQIKRHPDDHKNPEKRGQEYLADDVRYPSSFVGALRMVFERSIRLELAEVDNLEDAISTIEAIGERLTKVAHAEVESALAALSGLRRG